MAAYRRPEQRGCKRNMGKRGVRSGSRYFETTAAVDNDGAYDCYTNAEEKQEPSEAKLSQSSRNYLCQIQKVLDDGFQEQDEKDMFITNVFSSVDGEEVESAQDVRTSRVMEKILRFCNEAHVAHYAGRISDSLADLCVHRSGSHVVQTLLEVIQSIEQRGVVEDEKKTSNTTKFIAQLVNIFCSRIDELIVHQYASHVICSLVEVLSNTKVSANVHQSTKSQRTSFNKDDGTKEMLPADERINKKFKSHFKRLVKAIQQLDNLHELIKDPHSSSVLQTTTLALSAFNADSCEQFVNTLLESLSSLEGGLIVNSADRNCAHLVEKIIEVLTPKLFEKIFKHNFKGKLEELAVNSRANFVVQHILKHCQSKPLFEKIYAELENCWRVISNEGHFGILTSMCESCVRLNACQAKFITNLAKLLKCDESDERRAHFVLLVAHLIPYDEWQELSVDERSAMSFNYHGSVLLQNILRFQNTHQVVNNLIKTPKKDLQKLFCSSYGSYVVDALVLSDTVSLKSRASIIHQLKDCFVNLACDKYGSRCLEALWRVAESKQKALIVEELAESDERLRDDNIGAYALNMYAVSLFKRRPDEWTKWQTNSDRKKRLFEDFFDTAKEKKSKKNV